MAFKQKPAYEMIMRHAQDPQKVAQFSARMLRLQHELEGTNAAAQANSAETRKRLDSLGSDIPHARDDQHKQALIREYLDVALKLPADEQPDYMQKLNRIAGAHQKSDPALADVLWDAIESEKDERKKQDLIREYVLLLN